MEQAIAFDTKNPHYEGWTEIVENIARYFLSTVESNWNEYVKRISTLSEKDLDLENQRIKDIDIALEAHKTQMNEYLDKIRELRRVAVETYDRYRQTKVPYELFEKVFSYRKDKKELPENDRIAYEKICTERETLLVETKHIWEEITRVKAAYSSFMDGKGDYFNSLRREKKNIQNRISYQFQKNLGAILLADKRKVSTIISSNNMVASFHYFFRSLCTNICPNFFNIFSAMDREEITSRFFTTLIEKGGGENIEFVRLLYKQNEAGEFVSLYSDEEICKTFLKGYYNTIKGILIKSLKHYQDENIRLVRVDGINYQNDDGDENGNHGYDFVSNGSYSFDNDISKTPAKIDTMELDDVKECWQNFSKFLNKNFAYFADVVSCTFYNKDKFYRLYSKEEFDKICRYILDNLDCEIRNDMYSAKRLKAFVFSAFGGSRSRTYNVKETQVINQILVMFLCEYIYKHGSDSRVRKSSVFYDKIKNIVTDGIMETWRSSSNIFSEKVNGFIEDFEKKHNFFFEK